MLSFVNGESGPLRTYTRSHTLDLGQYPVLKKLSLLLIVLDPSHGTCHWDLVSQLPEVGFTMGTDGF